MKKSMREKLRPDIMKMWQGKWIPVMGMPPKKGETVLFSVKCWEDHKQHCPRVTVGWVDTHIQTDGKEYVHIQLMCINKEHKVQESNQECCHHFDPSPIFWMPIPERPDADYTFEHVQQFGDQWRNEL